MKISFNQACSLENSTLEKDLKLCVDSGFDAIELRIDKLKEYLETHTVEELTAFFKENKIKPYSINGIYVYTDFLSAKDDKKKADNLIQDIKYACEMGAAIGCNKMIMVPPVYSEAEGKVYDDPWEKIVDDNVRIFKAMSAFVRPYGMNIGIEIVGAPRSSIRTVEQCNVILDKVNEDNVGYTIDTYNLYLFNKTNHFESIRNAYPEKIFIVHINGGEECPADEYLQKNRTFADRGVVDVSDFLKNLASIGYDEYVSIEFFRKDCWAKPAEELIPECYTTTKKAIEKAGLIYG